MSQKSVRNRRDVVRSKTIFTKFLKYAPLVRRTISENILETYEQRENTQFIKLFVRGRVLTERILASLYQRFRFRKKNYFRRFMYNMNH